MGLDDDVIAVRPNGLGRADVDALVAAWLLRPAVGADRRLVLEVFRLLELAHRCRHVGQRVGLGTGILAGVPVTLRRLMHGEVRHAVEIEHEIEVLAARLRGTLEIDGADRAAGHHALAMILAAIEVDLIAPVDGVLGTDLDAGVAARANIEIDRVFLAPRDIEGPEPAAYRFDAA